MLRYHASTRRGRLAAIVPLIVLSVAIGEANAGPGERQYSERVADQIIQNGLLSQVTLHRHSGSPEQALAAYPTEWKVQDEACLAPFHAAEWTIVSCVDDDMLYTAQAITIAPDLSEVIEAKATLAEPSSLRTSLATRSNVEASKQLLLDTSSHDVTGDARLYLEARPGSVAHWQKRTLAQLRREGWKTLSPPGMFASGQMHTLGRSDERLTLLLMSAGAQTQLLWLKEVPP